MPAHELTGRDRELEILTGLVAGVAERGGALMVVGEAGIGKSSLLDAAAAAARAASFRVLSATGIEAEATLPFGGLHQLLRPVLKAAARLPETQRLALSAAFGAHHRQPPEPFMIGLAALNLLAEVAEERPVLLVVDDLHWLDRPSQDALTFIARRIGADPILLIGSARSGYDSALAAAGLPELPVRGLDDVSARAVLARYGGDLSHANRERILREALGNPLALVELPTALREAPDRGLEALPLTQRLERAFAARIADLSPVTRDAILVAAVDDSDGLPEILAGASGRAGQPTAVAALEPAVAAGLIRVEDLHVHFRHPLVRSGILQRATVTRRHAAHAALAEVLADQPYRRVWHRAQSITGPDDAVADELEDSCAISLRRGSVTAAIWALERSAELTTNPARRGRRLLLAAEHAFGLGRADLVDQLLAQAATTDLSRLDRARMEWLREIFNDGVPGDAGRVAELCDMAGQAAAAGDVDLALNLLLGAALRCWWSDTGPVARAQVAEVTERLREEAGRDPRYIAALAVAEPLLRGEATVHALGLVVLEGVTDPAALWLLGMAAHAVGEPVRAVDFFTRAETKLREQGRLGLLSQVLTMQVLDRLELGDWDRALAAVEEGRRLARETGQPIWDTGSMSVHACILALHGENERAQVMAAEAERGASGRRLNDLLACVQLARGLALLTAGQYTDAYEALHRLFEPDDQAFHLTERFHGVMFLAEAAVRAGHQDDARPVIAALAAETTVTPAATLLKHLSYASAVLADDDHAEAAFQTALREDLIRWPWIRARLELAYGSWLRRQRRVADSRPPLRSALTTFEVIGAGSWAAQARTELRAAGERPAGPETTTPTTETLSAQELQIARLAADGLSNREIGARLYLSPRTVGSHLYRIFPKLDITSRAQLASRLEPAETEPQTAVGSVGLLKRRGARARQDGPWT
jgi:DNA-binding CsgD family transcriptional regulator/tetratricopeptide (TPR) repeat protein